MALASNLSLNLLPLRLIYILLVILRQLLCRRTVPATDLLADDVDLLGGLLFPDNFLLQLLLLFGISMELFPRTRLLIKSFKFKEFTQVAEISVMDNYCYYCCYC